MIKSMTGYGATSLEQNGLTITVEVRSLNSKFIDTLLKLPRQFASRELEVKALAGDILQRGKISISIEVEKATPQTLSFIDEGLFLQYYDQLKSLRDKAGELNADIFHLALQMPKVIGHSDQGDDDAWEQVKKVILKALLACDTFRIADGEALKPAIIENIEKIDRSLDEITLIDPSRVEGIMKRIEGNLLQYISKGEIDKNRFEQEAIYFLEKLDINEEKARLKNHLDFFLDALNSDVSQGKKLGFITQEIGREINTIGSKANDSAVQHHVVEMKEELEKIREQLMNIL